MQTRLCTDFLCDHNVGVGHRSKLEHVRSSSFRTGAPITGGAHQIAGHRSAHIRTKISEKIFRASKRECGEKPKNLRSDPQGSPNRLRSAPREKHHAEGQRKPSAWLGLRSWICFLHTWSRQRLGISIRLGPGSKRERCLRLPGLDRGIIRQQQSRRTDRNGISRRFCSTTSIGPASAAKVAG